MATTEMKIEDRKGEWKQQAWIGNLPEDFLRVSASTSQLQEAADAQTARTLQTHYSQAFHMGMANVVGRLVISIDQAKLTKNYGMTRMDPYVRLHIGHTVYETHTCINGARNPHWNKVQRCYIPAGLNKFNLEIYDERSLTVDELIAWTEINIPETVLTKGETHDDWYTLSGKQGVDLEGSIHLVLSFEKVQSYAAPAPVMVVPGVPGQMYLTQPGQGYFPQQPVPRQQQQQQQPTPELSTELLEELQDMFPSMEESVIRSVFEASRGNKEVVVSSLLQMSS